MPSSVCTYINYMRLYTRMNWNDNCPYCRYITTALVPCACAPCTPGKFESLLPTFECVCGLVCVCVCIEKFYIQRVKSIA